MSTLIRKELRENFKLAVIGFGLFVFILVLNYRSCTSFYALLALGQESWNYNNAQPLLSGSLTSLTGVFCALFGAVLGWLQVHNEGHRDLWAFLIHRPLSRTNIFAAKTVAGLCLYTLGAGLPLFGLIMMSWMPGQIAAPFEWTMVLPVLAFFLAGIVCYFAGMLTGLRQARWYASRGLGFGAACIVCMGMANVPEFSRALVFILVGGAAMATAAWGSFMSNGYYAGQPALGRRALVGSLSLGCLVVVGLALVPAARRSLHLVALSNYQRRRGLQVDPGVRQTAGNHRPQGRAAERFEDRPPDHPERLQSSGGSGIRCPSEFRRPGENSRPVLWRLPAKRTLLHLVAPNTRHLMVLDLEWPAIGL